MTNSKIRNATSIVMYRDAPDGSGLQVFTQKRAATMSFGGGTVAFPGGGAEPEDDRVAQSTCLGDDSESNGGHLGLEEWEYDMAAVTGAREVFEETGATLMDTIEGSAPGRDVRNMLLNGDITFHEVVRDHCTGTIDVDRFTPLARWATPEEIGAPKLYDTTYFAVELPPNSPQPDGNTSEAESVSWVAPEVLLNRWAAGQVELMPATYFILTTITHFDTAEELYCELLNTFTPSVSDNRLYGDPIMAPYYNRCDINGNRIADCIVGSDDNGQPVSSPGDTITVHGPRTGLDTYPNAAGEEDLSPWWARHFDDTGWITRDEATEIMDRIRLGEIVNPVQLADVVNRAVNRKYQREQYHL